MTFSRTAAALFGLGFLLLAAAAPAQEGATPFDMSGERGPEEKRTPATDKKQTVTGPATRETGGRRYIIPAPSLLLEGEMASRSFPVYLTKEEAASARAINFGYTNAVVVAPESSRIAVVVNDVEVGGLPVRSADGTADIRLNLPEGLLRPGVNRITFDVAQRHRTDCTIRSTYDLWTAIDPARTFLDVPAERTQRLLATDDIAAIGLGPAGQTKFVLVVPQMGQPVATSALMRLSQGLALMAKMPNQAFEVVDSVPATAGPGELTIVVGTSGELAPLLPQLPAAASTSAVATFVDAPAAGRKVFVVSGPDWTSIEGAVEGLVSPLDRPAGVTREALSLRQRNATEMPLVTDEASLSLAYLGVRTAEFTGRRFRTGLDIGIPSDFYADAYGEATLLLDAAYSPDVLPGSHIDIYINGNIASTVPITNRNGGIFRHLPIQVTMRHFHPGPNRIDIEAVLLTQADDVCAPGATALQEPRFALFDSSELRIPRFARVAQLPNLAALAGTGFPYNRAAEPTALYLDRLDGDTLSAGATLLGKLAVASGRALPVRPETSALAIGERNAILVGTISQLPPLLLAQAHVAPESASTWGAPVSGDGLPGATEQAFDEWQSRVRGGSWRGQISALEAWLQQTFDISLSSLRLLPEDEEKIVPDSEARFLVAQGDSPQRTSTWTLLAAPTGADLKAGMTTVAQDARWYRLGGYASLESRANETLDTRPVSRARFVSTQPWSFTNLRLIAANWLSSNILVYALLLCLLSILLGVSTFRLLRRIGRSG